MKTIMLTQHLLTASTLGCAMALTPAHGVDAPKLKMTTEIPASIATPDEVKTRLGTLLLTSCANTMLETPEKKISLTTGEKRRPADACARSDRPHNREGKSK
jgi:hypothetical protein